MWSFTRCWVHVMSRLKLWYLVTLFSFMACRSIGFCFKYLSWYSMVCTEYKSVWLSIFWSLITNGGRCNFLPLSQYNTHVTGFGNLCNRTWVFYKKWSVRVIITRMFILYKLRISHDVSYKFLMTFNSCNNECAWYTCAFIYMNERKSRVPCHCNFKHSFVRSEFV